MLCSLATPRLEFQNVPHVLARGPPPGHSAQRPFARLAGRVRHREVELLVHDQQTLEEIRAAPELGHLHMNGGGIPPTLSNVVVTALAELVVARDDLALLEMGESPRERVVELRHARVPKVPQERVVVRLAWGAGRPR